MKFPIFKTKMDGSQMKFNLNDPKERAEYFQYKAGDEIAKLKEFIDNNSFIVYLLGKKNSGKGTYSKMFAEIVNPQKIDHFSVGDMIRAVSKEIEDPQKKDELVKFLEKNYRGYMSVSDAMQALLSRDTKTLLPTEFILALVKREIAKREKKTLFIDGFPRDMDQVSYSLFFRDLVGFREDMDIFVLIDVPKNVIGERIKYRRICPVCQTSRSLKLLPTSKVGYDQEKKEFFLLCDNDDAKMVGKEGDEMGIEPIRQRLELDEKLMEKTLTLHGIPKILLRNSIPVEEAKNYVDDYEITPEYEFEWDEAEKKVKTKEKPWTVKDDEGNDSYSLLAAPVVVSLIKQLAKTFDL